MTIQAIVREDKVAYLPNIRVKILAGSHRGKEGVVGSAKPSYRNEGKIEVLVGNHNKSVWCKPEWLQPVERPQPQPEKSSEVQPDAQVLETTDKGDDRRSIGASENSVSPANGLEATGPDGLLTQDNYDIHSNPKPDEAADSESLAQDSQDNLIDSQADVLAVEESKTQDNPWGMNSEFDMTVHGQAVAVKFSPNWAQSFRIHRFEFSGSIISTTSYRCEYVPADEAESQFQTPQECAAFMAQSLAEDFAKERDKTARQNKARSRKNAPTTLVLGNSSHLEEFATRPPEPRQQDALAHLELTTKDNSCNSITVAETSISLANESESFNSALGGVHRAGLPEDNQPEKDELVVAATGSNAIAQVQPDLTELTGQVTSDSATPGPNVSSYPLMDVRTEQAVDDESKAITLPQAPSSPCVVLDSALTPVISEASRSNPMNQASPALTVEVLEPLTPEEESERHRLELKVERAFYEAGSSLRELRDRRLYRSTHKTFEQYCRERFGFERRHPYRLIEAANVMDNLCPIRTQEVPSIRTQILPTKLEQVRPLTSLEPDEQRQVWQQAVNKAGGYNNNNINFHNI